MQIRTVMSWPALWAMKISKANTNQKVLLPTMPTPSSVPTKPRVTSWLKSATPGEAMSGREPGMTETPDGPLNSKRKLDFKEAMMGSST